MARFLTLLLTPMTFAALLLPALPRTALASDLAILTQGDSVAPNIMLILDGSGSMSNPPSACGACGSKRSIAKTALRDLVLAINPPDGSGGYVENARFGLATYRSNGANLLVPVASGNTQTVLDQISTAPTTSVGTPVGGGALDIGRYYAGPDGWGTMPAWGTLAGETAQPDPLDLACRKSFIIYLTDGLPNKDSIVRAGFWATIGDADGDTGTGEGDAEDNSATVTDDDIQWGDDITYAMFRTDFAAALPGRQNVTTHMVGFDVDSPILERMAQNGGGNYYTATDAGQLAVALASATQAVMDSVSSFSSAVVPASRTIFGAAFYNAFFEPRANKPVWAGHLEAYRLSPQGEIQDRNGDPAVDAATGQLLDPHLPYWDAGEELATNGMRDLYTTVGGAQVRFDTSNVDETDLALSLADLPFYPNAAALGIDTLPELSDALVGFVHGEDAFDEDGDSDVNELRDIVLGDIFHSTPRVVSAPTRLLLRESGYLSFYNNYLGRDRVIYAGSNTGMLHGFDAGQRYAGDNPATPETESFYYTPGTGAERFGYVPGHLLDKLKMIPRNTPRTFFYVDGDPAVAEAWLGDGSGTDITKSVDEWATVMITGYREGGPGYLALDVTDPDAGAADAHGPYPVLQWEFTHPKLGETWSEPIITRVKLRGVGGSGDLCGYDDGDGDCREEWVAIFAGGYEETADPNSPSFEGDPLAAGWSDRGRALFMVSLESGQVLASVEYDSSGTDGPAEMLYATPSTPAVLDLDFDGFADVVYVGDLGGQMWKWNIRPVGVNSSGDARIDNWPAGVFFRTDPVAMGGGVLHYRSFFYPPAASYLRGKLLLSFGSGERDDLGYKGDASYDENNRFYVMVDPQPVGPLAFATTTTDLDLSDVTSVDSDPNTTNRGYHFKAVDGEKFIGSPVIFAGYVLASSYEPATGADPCLNAGSAFLYAFRLKDGLGLIADPMATAMEKRRRAVGGGLPSSPRVSMATDADDDEIYVKTSKGDIITVDPPDRSDDGASIIYWTPRY